jgi:hypothetical protein
LQLPKRHLVAERFGKSLRENNKKEPPGSQPVAALAVSWRGVGGAADHRTAAASGEMISLESDAATSV